MHAMSHTLAHAQVDMTLELFDTLLAQHREVSQKGKALHSSCEQLVKEKDQLIEFADALRTKLKFFDEFETVYAQLQKVQQVQQALSMDNVHLLELLKKLDECMAYVASNPQYADASTYTTKFRQLQGRALGAVRNKVQQVLKHAVQQVRLGVCVCVCVCVCACASERAHTGAQARRAAGVAGGGGWTGGGRGRWPLRLRV